MKFNLEHYFIFNFDPNNLENLFLRILITTILKLSHL